MLPAITSISQRLNKTPAQIIFRFSIDVGIIPLTGTTSLSHMEEDFSLDFILNDAEINFIEKIGIELQGG